MVPDIAADGRSGVKMVVSYGGEIVRCPDTGKARYAGGENRIVRVGMSELLGELRARLAELAGFRSGVRIRYALLGAGGDGLDSLYDVADDHDLWVLVTRLCCCDSLGVRHDRVRAFLSPAVDAPPPERIRRRASSPLLLHRSADKEASAAITRAQSAVALYAPAAASQVTSSGGGAATASAAQVDLGFEALAEIAAAQRSATGYGASSSATTSGGGGGSDALAAIAVAQRSAPEHYSACRAPATCAGQAYRGFEAVTAVAAEQSGQARPPPAPVFLVPVPLTAVFFRAIPVYGCYVPDAVM
ncbi:unnamed protein product [Urochloa decumbens]|uniref:PB1 domain-containing protein n=1 Tax=Urochloa decumbens TaxID=240449 RepID=A0ABC9CYY7_9POAL